MTDYGAASHLDFDNPNKWVTVAGVPLLDEHEMTGEDGQPIAQVDRRALEEIAHNNNRKVRETGDPATLILGHTSDDPRAAEKPAQGFVVNYKVKPFKRNPDGQIIYAIHGDYKLRPNKAHLIEEYPRRSVELWWHKKDIDPIAMLGGSSPERDLSVVLRHARLNHVSMDVNSSSNSGIRNSVSANPNTEGVIYFSTKGGYSIETYTIGDSIPTYKYSKRRITQKGTQTYTIPDGRKGETKIVPKVAKYAEAEDEAEQYSPEDLVRMKGPEEKRRKEQEAKKKQDAADKDALEGRRGRRTLPPFHNSRSNDMSKRNKNGTAKKYGMSGFGGGMDKGMTPGSKPIQSNPRHPTEIPEMDEGPNEVDENNRGSEMSAGLDDAGYGAGPEQYDAQDMEDEGDGTEDYDGGGEAIPGGEGSMDGDGETDPVLAKVFQSKQWNEMSSGISQIKEMLQGMMGGEQEQEGMGGMDEGDGGMDGSDEMPAPSPSDGQAPMPDGMDEGGEGEEEDPDQDERMMHGQKPVKMGAAEGIPHSTGMPGPSDGYVPTFSKSKSKPSSKMSRGTNMPAIQSKKEDKRDRVIRDLRIQLSRMKAQADIQQLESEGVLFGPSPELADKIKYQRQEELTLAYLHDEDSGDEGEPDTYVKDKIEEMRVCYSRRRPDPIRRSTPNVASVAKYARTQADVAGQPTPESNDEDFEDQLGTVGSFEAINEFCELQSGPRKMSRQDSIKFMRKKYSLR